MSGQISAHKTDHSEDPVQYHGDPDTDGSVTHVHTDDIAESDTEHEHGKIDSTMVNRTSLQARSIFGRTKDAGHKNIAIPLWIMTRI